MNDSETRTMSFTQNMDVPLTVSAGNQGIASFFPFMEILSGERTTGSGAPRVTQSSGRIWHAGMMYDRFRVKTCSVQVRPKIMPAATGVPNYTFYLAWDRYFQDFSAVETADPRIVTDDPSAKMVVWTPGGSGTPLTHYVYSLPKDRYQYVPIDHNGSISWDMGNANSLSRGAFVPTLRYVLDLGSDQVSSLTVRLIFQFRFTLEFMGAASYGVGTDRSFQVIAAPIPDCPADAPLPLSPRL